MSNMTLKINGLEFSYFNRFNVSLIHNSIASVFSFDGLSVEEDQKKLFKPLQYHEVKVYYNQSLLISGTGLNTSTSIQNEETLAGISGYSRPGVLGDCPVPLEAYPLQSTGLSLKEIAEKLIKQFGLRLNIDSNVLAEASKVYETEAAEASETISAYLMKLCKPRNILLTHDYLGNLVFTRLNLNAKSIATYREGMPATKITLSVNGQGVHSKISALKQATIDSDNEGQAEETNSLVRAYRPTVVVQSSGDNDDTALLANQERGKELRNIALIIETDRFTWYDGKKVRILRPNNIIDVISPSNFITRRTRFFVEKIEFNGDSEGIGATITCVVPEVYNGAKPQNYFR